MRRGAPFDFILNRAKELAQRLIDAHALFCASNAYLLEQEPTTWLEMKGVVRAEAVHGYMHRSLGASTRSCGISTPAGRTHVVRRAGEADCAGRNAAGA